MAESGNANSSTKTLKRMEFAFKGHSYQFLLNPETYEQTEPGKVSVTQTKGGAFVEAFGAGIVEITISGTTGFRNRTHRNESGYEKFKELRDLIKAVYNSVEDGAEIKDLLEFYNYTDNEYWLTYPDKFELSRSKSQPLLYKYSIHLYCIRGIGEPEPSDAVTIIGNPLGAEGTYDATIHAADPSTTSNPVPTTTPTTSTPTYSYYSNGPDDPLASVPVITVTVPSGPVVVNPYGMAVAP